MRIRDATGDDVELIATFNERLADDSNDKRPDPAVLRRGVQRALRTPTLSRYFLAEVDGEPVGQLMLTYELSDWRDGVIHWIQSVYVRPEHRGTGVFRALFDHVAALGKADPDCCALRLYVLRENERARAAYTRCGMTESDYLVYELDWALPAH